MFPGLRALLGEREGKILVMLAISTIAFGTVAYTRLEGWAPIDALYFSVVTLATVGFGDLVPTTDPGKLFTVGYILFGVGIIAAFAAELTKDRRAVIAGRMAASRPTRREPPGIGPEA
jgi:voltage-gated potassium channel Kch